MTATPHPALSPPTLPRRRRVAFSGPIAVAGLALFLFLFSVYLLTYTPAINSSDGLAMFATAESLARRGALDVEQIRWMDLQQGTYALDGLLYSRKGIGLPLGLLPLTWLGLVVPGWGPVGASLLFNALVTALTGVLLLAYLARLGFDRRAALGAALAYGLLTPAWPYAKSLFSDPFSGLLLLAAAYFLLRFRQALAPLPNNVSPPVPPRGGETEIPLSGGLGGPTVVPSPAPLPLAPGPWPLPPTLLFPFLAGLCLGWNVATRYAEAVFVPVFGLLLWYGGRGSGVRGRGSGVGGWGWGPVVVFVAPLAAVGLGLMGFNWSRYGDPLNTGYLPNETFSGVLWQGVLGQLFSPGRGLFLYSPVLLLSLAGLGPLLRRHRAEALAALAVIAVHLLLYGKWFMWHGGYAWGPRFLVPTLPFWAIFLAPVLEDVLAGKKPALGFLFWGLAGLSLVPQFLGLVVDFALFQNSLLETGLPLFAPVTFFAPGYSPLSGTWAWISPANLDLAWAWRGQVNPLLLAVLLGNVILSGVSFAFGIKASPPGSPEGNGVKLATAASPPSPPGGGTLALAERLPCAQPPCGIGGSGGLNLMPLSPGGGETRGGVGRWAIGALAANLVAAGLLLAHAHTLPDGPLRPAVEALNQAVRPQDAVIRNDPESTMPFAELYRGRAPVLGLNNGGFPLPEDITARLEGTMAGHEQIWWLPNWLPPEESAVEQLLLADCFRTRQEDFGGQRLLLFACPRHLDRLARPVELTFAGGLRLQTVAYLDPVSAGTALPLELAWLALARPEKDYHVFVHLIDRAGRTIAQADGQPANWTRPTTTWAVGETVIDRRGLWLPPGVPAGAYQLRIGLYDPADGGRLPLEDGSDGVVLPVTVR